MIAEDADQCTECVIIDDILQCYQCLSKLSSLEPSPTVDRLFGKLVHLCISQPLDEASVAVILTDSRIENIVLHLRHLCSEGEYCLEAHWAKKILSNASQDEGTAYDRLCEFPYYQNYVDLVRMEMNALYSVTAKETLKNFAILGSGPLPLTSLCIWKALRDRPRGPPSILNLDNDPTAILQSSKLCSMLGHTEKTMCFECADAMTGTVDLSHFDVVYLAALVGTCYEHKLQTIANVAKTMRPGALLLLRTAHSLRGLLYPVVHVSKEMCSTGLRPLLTLHPYNHIINSITICRVDAASSCASA